MLHHYFSEVFVINLQRREDRMIDFMKHAEENNITEYRRVLAVDGKQIDFKNPLQIPHFHPGDVGCVLSHLKVVQKAKELNLDSYCVLEDDVLFRKGFPSLFNLFYKEIPEDWDMIYFGANHNNTNPPHVSSHAVRVCGSYTTHAMAVKHTMYDDLIKTWSDPIRQVDVLLSDLHTKYKCYCFSPNLAGQRAGKSDILDRDVNYDFLLK